MPGQGKAKKNKKAKVDQGERQTNLAEGEPDIVEQSIEIHERKDDEQGGGKESR